MADITSSVAAPFIPEIWANKALEVLRSAIVLAPRVTKSSEISGEFTVGNTLSIPYPGTFVANSKTEGSPVTLQTPTGSSVTVTLNKHKETSFIIEDFARALALPGAMDAYMQSALIPIVNQVEDDLFSTYSTFTGSVGTAGTDLTAASLRAVSKKFTDNLVDAQNRYVAISTKDEASLLADTSLQSFFAFNEGARGDISNGLIAQNIYGLKLLVSQRVPTTGATPVATHNLAFNPGAIVLASRPLPQAPAGSGVQQTTVQDPASGLILRVTLGYDKSYLGLQVTIDMLYGIAVLRDAKGFQVLS